MLMKQISPENRRKDSVAADESVHSRLHTLTGENRDNHTCDNLVRFGSRHSADDGSVLMLHIHSRSDWLCRSLHMNRNDHGNNDCCPYSQSLVHKADDTNSHLNRELLILCRDSNNHHFDIALHNYKSRIGWNYKNHLKYHKNRTALGVRTVGTKPRSRFSKTCSRSRLSGGLKSLQVSVSVSVLGSVTSEIFERNPKFARKMPRKSRKLNVFWQLLTLLADFLHFGSFRPISLLRDHKSWQAKKFIAFFIPLSANHWALPTHNFTISNRNIVKICHNAIKTKSMRKCLEILRIILLSYCAPLSTHIIYISAY